MYDVFISYARADKPRAAQFQHAIKRCGWSVWWDADLLPGQQWNDVIEKELRAAGAVLVLWSKESVNSQFVCDEATIARELGKLVPVTLDGQRPKVGMGQLQLENMSSWDGKDSDHPGLIKVLSGIRQILKNTPGHEPRPEPHEPAPSFKVERSVTPKATVLAAAVVIALALGVVAAIPYFGGNTPSTPSSGNGGAPPAAGATTGAEPSNTAKPEPPKVKGKTGTATNPERPVNPPANPSVVAPRPEATPTGGITGSAAAATTGTAAPGCASLIAATRKQPDFAEGFFDLGKCHYAEGRFNDSVRAYSSAIALNDNLPKYYEGRGLAKWKNNLADQGIIDLDSAIELAPKNGSLYESRGQIYLATRKYQNAMDDYDKATRMNEKSKRAWLGLAEAAEKNGSPEIAESAKARAEALP